MTKWNPTQYLRFSNQRLRPALDLLAHVPLEAPTNVYDLGCGPGTATVHIKARWPEANVTGVDGSEPMLERAREEHADINWQHGDLREWQPDATPDLLYSNATLHWLGDHETLFPRLASLLDKGGVLAVQMPRNFGEPSHTTIFDTMRAHDWRDRLMPLLNEVPTQPPTFYYDLLRPLFTTLDVWETQYYQVMEGEHPIVEFTKGSFLRPILDALNEEEGAAFLKEYAERVGPAYPRRPDGTTLLPFRRLFLMAIK
jgi:trans-aconitate 2-methyltransferase